jgi:ketosteroid isomerase-like protein
MPQANEELVLRSIPAPDVDIAPLFRDDEMWASVSAAFAPVLHADFRCTAALFGSEISYVGIDGFRALWLDWLAPWATYRTETEETIDLGDRVVWLGLDFGRRKGSTGDVKGDVAVLWTFRDGKVVRWDGYTDRAAALKDVGLEG